ncbi:antibiotic biosynthesis monooxygenase family protein [Pseudaminobacter soli (ex Li et al. 2025)]|uniref:Antibiotic biosynthesis monooxygenase n=1 Tax=Pseudaminobacter soli (ex Li et al. 2025) TaxID=1295366 RepID=A0A2P7RXL0_9HYPH|nr:antibiotic biosynthesis monooxygenase family protein [Mesorhizobium soli]PSJ54929.1 antibiotic biosynthesis monooxygenase [Mesorhizobium soli]
MPGNTSKSQRIYRVDRFAVPISVRAEFLDRVRQTHEVLRTQPGFLQDMLLEQAAGNEHHIVTIVEWEDAAALAPAKVNVQAMQRKMNFDPQEFLAQNGIKAEIGNYLSI